MTKERRFWFSAAFCLMAVIPLLLGACLNPVDFNTEDLPRIPVHVTGEISIKDVAVFWLINRTKDVDVTEFIIDRPDEDGTDEAYPKTYTGKPASGTSLASYHDPMEEHYTVSVETAGAVSKDFSFEVQFPRAQDYRYYLYWTTGGELVLVDETRMTDLPPDPNNNLPTPGPNPAADDSNTMVVFNVTRDQNIDEVEFTLGSNSYSITNEPKAKDQQMILLAANSYKTTVSYTKGGTQHTIGPKTSVVTGEDTSMAVRTNFLYFYKTTSGDYATSQTWPPIPNDASDENSLEDALPSGAGMLRIINKALAGQPNAIVTRIRIGPEGEPAEEKPNDTNTAPYMIPGDILNYMLDEGTYNVAFRAMNQNMYGITIPRVIESRRITTLEYIGEFANPDFIPPDAGFGAGLVRIINNSYGLVTSATVFNLNDLSKSMIYGYEDFNPPQMINNGQTGRVSVIGTAEFPLNGGARQLIQVDLDTDTGPVTIQRPVSINGAIVDVVITQDDLKESRRIGSKVTVTNSTISPTVIKSIQVYNKDNPGVSVVYGLNVSQGDSPPIYVLSGTGFPIISGEEYAAKLTVYASNGSSATIPKEFTPSATLYSTTPDSSLRYITLEESDLPDNLKFHAITGIKNPPSNLTATTTYTTGGNTVTQPGNLDFNTVSLTFNPENASKTSPVVWTTADSGISISNNVLTVTSSTIGVSVPQNGTANRTVHVTATVLGGGANGGLYTSSSIAVILPYSDSTAPSSVLVTSISLTTPSPIAVGQALSLPSLATFNPQGAHINGTPVTTANLTWAIISGTGASVSGGTFTAATPGTYTVQATLSDAYTNDGNPKTATTTVTVTHPATLTLRIILSNKKDSVKQIAIVPIDRGNSSNSFGPVYSSGYTGEQWAVGGEDPTFTTLNRFAKRWPTAIYKTVDIPKGVGNYRDVTIDWPSTGGFYLFFLEGDNRARGYCYPGNKTAPTRAENYLFYIRPEALSPIWLDIDSREKAPGTAGAVPVIPISYHTDNNVSSIMWSLGVGNIPGYRVTF